MKDYYSILQIEHTATIYQIKRAFRKLVLVVHPKVNTSINAKQEFIDLNEAYNVLSNPLKRIQYDILYKVEILHKKPKKEKVYEKRHDKWEKSVNKSAEKGKKKGEKRSVEKPEKYKKRIDNSSNWDWLELFPSVLEIVLRIIFKF